MNNVIQETEKYCANNYKPLDVVLTKGEGIWVWDTEGNKYMDMLAAYSAVNQGHRHPKIVQAAKDQMDKITITSRAFHNDVMGSMLKKLCDVTGFEKALPMNTGAEAVETALKAARKWGEKVKGVPANQGEIIVFANNFHGRTITIISMSSEEQYRDGFGPLTDGFIILPYNDLEAVKEAVTPNTVAILAEPIQGEGGVMIPDEGYLTGLRKIATDNNVLLMFDEIQTGFGRTGKLFAFDYEDAKPDVVTVGKALGGGVYPVSAMLSSAEVMDVFKPGDHGSTFGGNPLGAAVAAAALDVITEENLPKRSFELGQYFAGLLRSMDSAAVKEVRAKGLMIGLEINEGYPAGRNYCLKLKEKGILCKETHEMTIRFTPPLTITKEELDYAFNIIKEVFEA